MKILHMTLKRQWFDMIASGEKKEEYREIKPYWIDRLFTGKSAHCDVWDEPNLYDEMLGAMISPDGKGCNSEALMDCFDIKAKPFDLINFKNGYAKDAPLFNIEFKGIRIGTGRPEWGAVPGKQYIILSLGEIVLVDKYATV